ncbi:DUF5615 family PIN-like protein [Adhaeretor mobilis]|uniref:DUF5615 domain-containing protein n=1 Tax=Adhaeretor mobilis TaxID=1930276 RepID=A0A517MT98_9BACT|nr:DUF5615 family PIN-like protein [Adhaeretor mobilis]QDS98099.1 hypothetical protein HG15A2_13710 [Adhaeretor mobilis]
MLQLASDADLHGGIVKVLQKNSAIDFVRSIDVLPEGTEDPDVLAWAAGEGRVLISNDRQTMTDAAKTRMQQGLPMPGVIFTDIDNHSVGRAINDILVIAEAMPPEEARAIGLLYVPF